MVNLKESLEVATDGEPIEAVVIGVHDNERYRSQDERTRSPADKIDRILSWKEAAPILDYDYNNGFGGADCHPVYAWTKSRVLFVSEYDGATGINWVPRDPIAAAPNFSGND